MQLSCNYPRVVESLSVDPTQGLFSNLRQRNKPPKILGKLAKRLGSWWISQRSLGRQRRGNFVCGLCHPWWLANGHVASSVTKDHRVIQRKRPYFSCVTFGSNFYLKGSRQTCCDMPGDGGVSYPMAPWRSTLHWWDLFQIAARFLLSLRTSHDPINIALFDFCLNSTTLSVCLALSAPKQKCSLGPCLPNGILNIHVFTNEFQQYRRYKRYLSHDRPYALMGTGLIPTIESSAGDRIEN